MSSTVQAGDAVLEDDADAKGAGAHDEDGVESSRCRSAGSQAGALLCRQVE